MLAFHSNRIILRSSRLFQLALALCLLLAPASAQAAPEDDASIFASDAWDGLSEFASLARELLGPLGLRTPVQLDFGRLRPDGALLIINPEQELDRDSLTAFLADGGRVAILDDYGKSDSFLARFPIQKYDLTTPARKYLNQNPELALASPVPQLDGSAQVGHHPIVAQVKQLVTNHPRALTHPELTVLAVIEDQSGKKHPLALTGVIGKKGRLVVVADGSLPINFMLRYPDNRHFMQGVVDYLTLDPQAEGRRSLTTMAGTFESVGHYGEEESFSSWLKELLDQGLKRAAQVEEEGLPQLGFICAALALACWLLLSALKDTLEPQALLERLHSLILPANANSPRAQKYVKKGERKRLFFQLLLHIDNELSAHQTSLTASESELRARLQNARKNESEIQEILAFRKELLEDVKDAKRISPRVVSLRKLHSYYERCEQLFDEPRHLPHE